MAEFRSRITNRYCEARRSGIHGWGLFARCAIPPDTRIIEYIGERVSKDESNRRGLAREESAKETGEGAVYIFDLNDDWDLDGNFAWNLARLANHSCSPNCDAQNIDDHIWLVALKEIQPDEELTFDYGYDIEHFLDHPCRCGSKNCVGYIVSKDQRLRLKRILRQGKNRDNTTPAKPD